MPRQVSDRVRSAYDALRSDIISGAISPGDPLGEIALAERYGISRTPVREALHRLEAERLVERGVRGMQVRRPSPEEILDIYEVRISLEGAAARGAARRHTDLDLAVLHAAHDRMRALAEPTGRERAESNLRFHEAIWQASHSPTLMDLLTRINTHLISYPTTTLAVADRWSVAIAEHDELIAAVTERDEDSARRIAEEHMTRARDIRLAMYAGD